MICWFAACVRSAVQVLIEAGQRLPDGRLRQRGLPLSEKMIGQEDWQTAAVRAVSEELATALPQDWRQQVRLVKLLQYDQLFSADACCSSSPGGQLPLMSAPGSPTTSMRLNCIVFHLTSPTFSTTMLLPAAVVAAPGLHAMSFGPIAI